MAWSLSLPLIMAKLYDCEITKAEFLAARLCISQQEARAHCEGFRKTRTARWKVGPKGKPPQWVMVINGKMVLPTVPKFLRAGFNVSW